MRDFLRGDKVGRGQSGIARIAEQERRIPSPVWPGVLELLYGYVGTGNAPRAEGTWKNGNLIGRYS